ncbi:MAG: hydroxyacid dehydrogenase [Nannocystis sp.]|nr:NAD(P)-dependent oxidoreductase [Nannocystis sp.]MBA3550175.1 hydroxyacid dehydrogenase [Nannocystis sp.]
MLVLIADKFPAPGREILARSGEVVYRPELGESDLPAAIAESGADILVVRSTVVNAAALKTSARLSLVIRAGAGVNTIDLKTASERGIFVANCPGKNAIAVAELTMGLLLALDRRIVDATQELRQGVWNKGKFGKARGIKGQTLGLIGFGDIAREVAIRARAFAMKVQCFSPRLSAEQCGQLGVTPADSLEALLRTSDVVSVHVPFSKTTKHLIGAEQLACMRPDSILLHTSRGGVVDDAALLAAVKAGKLRAGLDVFEGEPAESKAEYRGLAAEHPDIYATPHIGASTEQAESAIADEVLRIIHDYVVQGVVHHSVNLADRSARFSLVVRHLDRVGVLAGVFAALREEQVNVQGMQNIIFAGGEAGCATITFEQEPSQALLQRLRAHEAILAVELRAAPI